MTECTDSPGTGVRRLAKKNGTVEDTTKADCVFGRRLVSGGGL